MSPDGTRYLYSYPGPDGLGGLNAIWINRIDVATSNVEDISFCFFCATSHGWLNDTSIAAFPRSENGARPSQVCRVASNAEVPGAGPSCVQVRRPIRAAASASRAATRPGRSSSPYSRPASGPG